MRYFLRAVGGVSVVELGVGLLFDRLDSALALLGVSVAVAVAVSIGARFSYATLNDAGVRTRVFGLPRRSCPWSQVADIEVRSNGPSTTVRVKRADGTWFSLGAPMTSTVMLDPQFNATAEQITNTWRSQVPEERQLPLASPRARTRRRLGIAVTTTVLWVGVPLMLLGAFLVAHENWADAQHGHVQAVVVAVDTSYTPAVYQLDAVPGSTFPASNVATSTTEAYCAEMANGTHVGDTVKLVYPHSDPGQLEDARLTKPWWHELLAPLAVAALGGLASLLIRRSLTKTHRLRHR